MLTGVLGTSARLLALLSLMQSRPAWLGSELAERLGVSARTIRRDVDQLRELGYPVEAVRGAAGYYRLGVGAKLPPLLLDDDEAVAVAIGLRAATGVSGIHESSARALAKLEQVLPHRLRSSVTALHQATSAGPQNTSTNAKDPEVDGATLAAIAAAIRDRHLFRFEYTRGVDGASDALPAGTAAPSGDKLVEPYRLVNWTRRWYLVGRQPETATWSSFRVDWITRRADTHRRFRPSPLPGEDYTAFVLRDVASTGWKVHARITVFAPAQEVLARINPTVGVVESIDEGRCVLMTGADSVETVAVYIGMLGLDFEVSEPPALVEHLRTVGERYLLAIGPTGAGGTEPRRDTAPP